MKRAKTGLMWLLSALLVVAGSSHLMTPALFVAIVPPGLPDPEWLNVISALAEIVLGVFLLEARVRVFAAWGIIALMIAVFPANVNVALQNIDMATGEAGAGDPFANYVRLPFQALFIVWAWWYTRPEPGSES